MPKSRRNKRLGTVGLAALAAATLGAVAFAVVDSNASATPTAVPTQVQKYYDENVANRSASPKAAAPTPKVADFEASSAKLRASKEPFNLTVIGDSTGYAKQGWVETAAKDIAVKSGRAVSTHLWSIEKGQYEAARVFGEGEPVLTIWNGSAPGRDADYSILNLSLMMPETPDMVIINHGHNVKATQTIRSLIFQAAAKAGPKASMAVMKQNPRMPDNEGAAQQESNMRDVASMVSEMPGVQLIDAHAALAPKLAGYIMPDGVHPNQDGYRVWTDVFLARLGFKS